MSKILMKASQRFLIIIDNSLRRGENAKISNNVSSRCFKTRLNQNSSHEQIFTGRRCKVDDRKKKDV